MVNQLICGAVGILTYLLLSGTPPFYGNSFELINEEIINGSFDYPEENGWDCVSDAAIDFIDSLLVTSPKQRMNVEQALEHPFITQNIHTILPELPEKLESSLNLYRSI